MKTPRLKKAALPNQLRVLRASRALTQQQIADAMHWPRDRYRRIEIGVSKPSLDEAVALARALGVALVEIWPDAGVEKVA